MKKIYLNYKKAEKVDMKDYYEKYDKSGRIDYSMSIGTPTVIRIDGTVTYLNDLPYLCRNPEDAQEVRQWLHGSDTYILFHWWRNNNGSVAV